MARRRSRPNCGSALPVLVIGLTAIGAGVVAPSAIVFAFGVPLVVGPFLLLIALRSALKKLSLERVFAPAVFEGETVEVRLLLHNRSRFPVFFPLVGDVFSPEFHAEKATVLPYRVMAGETVEAVYQGRCLLPRGIFKLGPSLLAVSDPFGWFQLSKKPGPDARIKVYPRVLPFGLAERPGRTTRTVREDQNLLRWGESLEFFSVRDYQVGDPPRRIHWPLSAHRGSPVVREFAQPSSGNVTLFIDAAQRALLGTGRGSSLEHVVRTTVAFANRALRSGHRVEVVAEGKESRQVPAGRGLGHLQAILDLVVAVRPDGAEPLEHVLARHRRRLRRGDTVVYPVSPYLAGSAAFFREVAALRQMGLRQVALVLDDRTFRALRYEETAERIVAADLLARFRALGAEAFLVSCGADLASTFSGEAA